MQRFREISLTAWSCALFCIAKLLMVSVVVLLTSNDVLSEELSLSLSGVPSIRSVYLNTQ